MNWECAVCHMNIEEERNCGIHIEKCHKSMTYLHVETLSSNIYSIRNKACQLVQKQPKLLADNQFYQSGCPEDNQLFRIKNIIIHITFYLSIIEWTTTNCGGQPRFLGRLSVGQLV